VKNNLTQLLPLAITTLLLAIAKPAMASNSLDSTISIQLEQIATILAILGICLIVINNYALGYGWQPHEENYREITRAGQLLIIAAAVATAACIFL
jgi:hypothetical protein